MRLVSINCSAKSFQNSIAAIDKNVYKPIQKLLGFLEI